MKQGTLDRDKIAGYDYGELGVARSPLSLEELRQLEETVGWTENDARILKRHMNIFRDHAEFMVDSWRAVIGRQPHLARWFFGPDGKRDESYAASVKKRFAQWVMDVASRQHDRDWLDYQEGIGLRHTPARKNQTDKAHTPSLVPLRFLMGFVPVVTLGARKFFTDSGVEGDELRKLEDAWTRAVHLHVTLWTRPYAREELW